MKSSIYLPLTVTDTHLSTARLCTYTYILPPLFLFLYFADFIFFRSPGNLEKNRYGDVPCLDQTRVKLIKRSGHTQVDR